MKDEDIDRTQAVFSFRCTRCYHQFALSDILTHKETGELHCSNPFCRGPVRQLLAEDDLYDTWGASEPNPDYVETESPHRKPTLMSKLRRLLGRRHERA